MIKLIIRSKDNACFAGKIRDLLKARCDLSRLIDVPNIKEDDDINNIHDCISAYFYAINPKTVNLGYPKLEKNLFNSLKTEIEDILKCTIDEIVSFEGYSKKSEKWYGIYASMSTKEQKKNSDDIFKQGKKYVKNIKKYTVPGKAQYLYKNLGVTTPRKTAVWKKREVDIYLNSLDNAEKVIKAFIEHPLFKTDNFIAEYVDEADWNRVGRYVVEKGKVTKSIDASNQKEKIEVACEILETTPREKGYYYSTKAKSYINFKKGDKIIKNDDVAKLEKLLSSKGTVDILLAKKFYKTYFYKTEDGTAKLDLKFLLSNKQTELLISVFDNVGFDIVNVLTN